MKLCKHVSRYRIALANGSDIIHEYTKGVSSVVVEGEVYKLLDGDNKLVFSAPLDSVIYIAQA